MNDNGPAPTNERPDPPPEPKWTDNDVQEFLDDRCPRYQKMMEENKRMSLLLEELWARLDDWNRH